MASEEAEKKWKFKNRGGKSYIKDLISFFSADFITLGFFEVAEVDRLEQLEKMQIPNKTAVSCKIIILIRDLLYLNNNSSNNFFGCLHYL